MYTRCASSYDQPESNPAPLHPRSSIHRGGALGVAVGEGGGAVWQYIWPHDMKTLQKNGVIFPQHKRPTPTWLIILVWLGK